MIWLWISSLRRSLVIVQTADNSLHFLGEYTESVPLFPEIATRDQNVRSAWSEETEDKSYYYPGMYGKEEKERSVASAQVSRIDSLSISNDGFLLFQNDKIPLSVLLLQPIQKDGIFVIASKTHTTRIIQETLLVTANIILDVLDTQENLRKVLFFEYLVYFYTSTRSYEISDCVLHIEDATYTFLSPVIAVYESRKQGGLRYLVRLYKPKEQKTVLPGLEGLPEHKTRNWFSIISTALFGVAAFTFVIVALNRRLIITDCISNGFWSGSFLGRKCLVYEVDSTWIRRHSGSPQPVPFVDILFVGRLFRLGLRRIACTEWTWQCTPNTTLLENCRSLVESIELLHARNIVHGYICPENARLTLHGSARFQDFFSNRGWRSPRQIRGAPLSPRDDWFSVGCLLHYLLTSTHPFDPRGADKPSRREAGHSESFSGSCPQVVSESNQCVYESVLEPEVIPVVEAHIISNSHVIRLSDQIEHDLVYTALFKASSDEGGLSQHPFFWSHQRRTELLCEFSDFIESSPQLKPRVERVAYVVFSDSWIDYLDPAIRANIGTKRRYDYSKLSDLLRLIRNSQRHVQELPYATSLFEKYGGQVGPYYMDVFPELFLIVYKNKDMRKSKHFSQYFPLRSE